MPPCRANWFKRLVAIAAAFAAGPPVGGPQPRAAGGSAAPGGVDGFLALMSRAAIPKDVANSLRGDASALRAAAVCRARGVRSGGPAVVGEVAALALQRRRVLSATAAPPAYAEFV